MADDEKQLKYEDFLQAADEFKSAEDEELLTDPEALAQSRDADEKKRAKEHGERLAANRHKLGLTLEELAQKADIDQTLLAQVEAGEAFLPLGKLLALSKALSLKVSEVISKGDQSYTIVRSDQRKRFSRFGKAKQTSHGYEYEALALDKKGRKMEPFVVTLARTDSEEHSSHDGQEFIYVLEGKIEVQLEGTTDILNPGDAIYYDSKSDHRVRAHGDQPAKILAVLCD